MLKTKLTIAAGLAALGLSLAPAAAQQPKDTLTVDQSGDVATLDPHLQWDGDSYAIYRNIFDNLVTRDVAGEIVPQVATAWRNLDDTTIEFDIREGIAFQDGTRLTPEDVVFSIRRIISPELKSPQLSQFDQIASAEVAGPSKAVVSSLDLN